MYIKKAFKKIVYRIGLNGYSRLQKSQIDTGKNGLKKNGDLESPLYEPAERHEKSDPRATAKNNYVIKLALAKEKCQW